MSTETRIVFVIVIAIAAYLALVTVLGLTGVIS